MKNKLLAIKQAKELSNYDLALDIGVSEFTVYSILHNTPIKHKKSTLKTINQYIERSIICGE